MAHVYTTTAELLKLGDGTISDIDVSELLEDTPLLRVLAAIEASHEVVHKWLKKTAAPAAGFRAVNAGLENTVATYAEVTQDLKLYDASFAIDVGLLKTQSGGLLKRREAVDHLRTAFVDMEKQIFYGTGAKAAGFAGLAQEAAVQYKNSAMVVDAAGTTANTGSSVWAIRSGESDVAAVYGAGGRIEIGDEYRTVLADSSGKTYDADRTPILFWGGLQVATTLTAARICNLTADGGKGLTDDLIAELLAKFPSGRGPTHLAMNRRSQMQLQQSRTATNATGAPAPFPTEAFGVPIVVTDQITSTEALLANAPGD